MRRVSGPAASRRCCRILQKIARSVSERYDNARQENARHAGVVAPVVQHALEQEHARPAPRGAGVRRRLRREEVGRLERDAPLRDQREHVRAGAPLRGRGLGGLRAVLHDAAQVRVRGRDLDGDAADATADVDDELAGCERREGVVCTVRARQGLRP